MSMFRKEVFFLTDVAHAVYIREPLMTLGINYDVRLEAPNVLRYTAELAKEEQKYVLDYLNQLYEMGIQPLR